MSLKKGFTLIELLVVISIIGLLSSVVLASLASSRVKGVDAAIRRDMVEIRTGAELQRATLSGVYNNTGSVVSSALCSTQVTPGTILANTNLQKAMIHIKQLNGNLDGRCNINALGTAYAIAFPLKTTQKFWCVDSSGVSRNKNSFGVEYDAATPVGSGGPLSSGNDFTCN